MIIPALRTAPGSVAEDRRQRPLASCRKRLACQDPGRAGQTRQPILEPCFPEAAERLCARAWCGGGVHRHPVDCRRGTGHEIQGVMTTMRSRSANSEVAVE